MKIIANNIRKGTILEYNSKLWSVTETKISQPGKGGSVIMVTMKDLDTGNKTNVRYNTGETVESVRIDSETFQYLYSNDDEYTFMNNDTYEQMTINKDLIGDSVVFLQDGMTVSMQMHEGTPIAVELPESVTLEISEADPVVKGQTASSSYKNAVLENGVKILVPPHIESGTRVVIRTADATYVEKAKD